MSSKKEGGKPPKMISLYLGENGCNKGSIPLSRHCLSTLKIKNEAKK